MTVIPEMVKIYAELYRNGKPMEKIPVVYREPVKKYIQTGEV